MTAFALAPIPAILDRRLGDADRRVLLSLFSFRSNSDDFVVWPSRQRIGERAGIQAVDRISRILTKLERLGWIERRQRRGSNIYRLTDRPDALADTLTDSADTLTNASQTDQTELTRPVIPPFPPLDIEADHVTVTPIQAELLQHNASLGDETETDTAIEQLAEPIEQPIRVEEEERQGEETETTEHQDALQPLESVQAPEQHQKPTERPTSRSERITAARRIVERLNQITGLQLPTGDDRGIAVRRAARALNRYTEAEIVQAIIVHAITFHRPSSILKQSILEPLVAQQRQRQHQEQERQRQHQEQLQAIKQANRPQGDKAVGRAHLDALKAMLGRSKKPLDEVMRA